MILVDTSVWIDHFREGVSALSELLDQHHVFMHTVVLGELACGNLKSRRETLRLLADLPSAPKASDHEVMEFIERRRLMGKGIGSVDAHLLAAVMLAPDARLWSRDKRLSRIARGLGVESRIENG